MRSCTRGNAHAKPLVGLCDVIMELDGYTQDAWPHGTTFSAVMGHHHQDCAPCIGLLSDSEGCGRSLDNILLKIWGLPGRCRSFEKCQLPCLRARA